MVALALLESLKHWSTSCELLLYNLDKQKKEESKQRISWKERVIETERTLWQEEMYDGSAFSFGIPTR